MPKTKEEPAPAPLCKQADEQGAISKGCGYAVVGFQIAQAMHHTGYNLLPKMAADMTLGLKMLGKHEKPAKEEHDASVIKESKHVKDKATVDELLYYARFVKASYRDSDEEMLAVAGCEAGDVIEVSRKSSPSRPAFFVMYDRTGHGQTGPAVVLTVRGTKSVGDALTDMASAQSKFMGTLAHSGMVKAANHFMSKKEKAKLLGYLKLHKCKRLVFAGHSLGAGTASLLTMSARADKDFGGVDVRGYCYAPPAAVNKKLAGAAGAGEGILSVVCGDDAVPRASLKSFHHLKTRLEEYDYVRKAQEKVLPTAVVNANYKVFGFAKKMAKKVVCATRPSKAVFNFVEHRLEIRDKHVADMEHLYPPGRLLHIARGESTDEDPAQLHSVHLLERDPLTFGAIGISGQMASDHKLGNYITALEALRAGM